MVFSTLPDQALLMLTKIALMATGPNSITKQNHKKGNNENCDDELLKL